MKKANDMMEIHSEDSSAFAFCRYLMEILF
ncbi:hypothetical protein JOD25_001093 [Kurthia huakuii]|nr:hypothetical protein [Kurthia huakuii]